MVEEFVVTSGRERRALEADDPAQLALIVGRELEHDRTAHRAAGDNRTFEIERLPDRANEGDVSLRRQPVLLEPPALWRIRAAVIRQVKRDDSKVRRDRFVGHQVTVLTAVSAGGMKTEKRNALPRFLEVDAVARLINLEVQVPTDDGIDLH